MRFCKDCGSVLNLFGSDDRELCSACVQHKKQVDPPPEPVVNKTPKAPDQNLLAEVVLSCKGNKIVLVSKEGWELWSAPIDSSTHLQSILTRAEKVYRIRLKRQKN